MLKRLTTETLSYYQDRLLPEEDQQALDAILESDPAERRRLRRLEELDNNLLELGRYTRVRQSALAAAVPQAIADHSPQSASSFSFSWMVFRPAFWAPAAAVAAFAVFVFGYALWFTPGGFTILKQTGDVRIVAARPEAAGPTVQINDRIEVNQGYIALRMGDGESFVEVGPQTQIQIQGPRRLRVESGVVCNQVARDESRPFIVDTPHGSVVVLGTVFEVQVGSRESEVRVGKGLVKLQAGASAAGPSQLVKSGCQAILRTDAITNPVPFEKTRFAPWREPFRAQKLDTPDIAKITSDKKFNP
ncbi:MAG: FecR domain-containing protein [bacterium]